MDWIAAGGAILGAVVAVFAVLRWRRHDRQRTVHLEFHWNSRTRDRLNEDESPDAEKPPD